MSLKAQAGQTLLELVMAIGVGVVVVTAIVSITTLSLKNSGFAKTNAQATRHSQEAIEWLRAERDKSWPTVFAKSGVTAQYYCLTNLAWPAAPGTCTATQYITGTTFKREISLINRDLEPSIDGNETIQAEVTVTWNDSSGDHQSKLTTQLTNWVTD